MLVSASIWASGSSVTKRRRDGRGPLAVDAAVGGVEDDAAPARAGDRDVGEAALLLEAGIAALVERALRGEDAFLPAGEEDGVELEALGGVDGHDRDLVGLAVGVVVHDQADMFEEGAERLIFLHRAGELGEILEPAGALGRAVGLEHRGVARFVEDEAGELGMGQLVELRAPAGEIADQIAERRGAPAGSARRCRGSARRPERAGCPRRGRAGGASPPPCRRGRAWGC